MPAKDSSLPMTDRRVATSDLKFDYRELPPSVEKFLRGQADRIRRQYTTCIIQIGKALLEAKRYLSHGVFLRWVESEVGIPCRTAQAYMRAADWAVGKSATVARLPASAIYVLSSNGVPNEFAADVLKRLEAGERIVASSIRQELKAYQQNGLERSTHVGSAQKAEGEYLFPTTIGVSHVSELVTLLARTLSERDLARVFQILTSESFWSDPGLREKIVHELRLAMANRMAAA